MNRYQSPKLLSDNQRNTLVFVSPTFSLENFEGPLELLLYLIQKDEINVCEIVIKQLTTQLLDTLNSTLEVDVNSEMLNLTATLLLLKSQRLLPQKESSEEKNNDNPRAVLIQSLIEYCHIKESAKILALKEQEQKSYFPRAVPPFKKEWESGLEEVDIEGLKSLLFNVVERAAQHPKHLIEREEWQVSHKIEWLRHTFTLHAQLSFETLFSEEKSRGELIVLFLALLEMMKQQELRVVRENENAYSIVKTCYESRA